MTDLLLLGGAALALLGYKNHHHDIFNILGWADNSGSIDTVTNKKDTASIGNFSPNLCGSGWWQTMTTLQPPDHPPIMGHRLHPVNPTHPGQSSPLITNFGSSNLIGY